MKGAIVIGDPGQHREELAQALAATPGIQLLGCLHGRRPIAAALTSLQPAIVLLVEPCSSPVPAAVIREARAATPFGVLVVRAASAAPTWVAEALNAGATTVLPATVDAEAIGRVVMEIVTENDTAQEALRLRWAA
jgi:DNA-binding NarL/FixJ family response regulator